MSFRKFRAAKAAVQKGASPSARRDPTVVALSADALWLVAQIEQALRQGRADVLTPEALQALMAAAFKLYAAQIEGRGMTSSARSTLFVRR